MLISYAIHQIRTWEQHLCCLISFLTWQGSWVLSCSSWCWLKLAIACELPFLSMCWSQHAHETVFCINYWFGISNVHFIPCRASDFQFHEQNIHGSIQGRKGVWILLQTKANQKKNLNKGFKNDYRLKLRWAEAWVKMSWSLGCSYKEKVLVYAPEFASKQHLWYTLPQRLPITWPKWFIPVYKDTLRYSNHSINSLN